MPEAPPTLPPSSPSPSPPSPSLPVELIVEILGEDSLERADFARICLVGRIWLGPAQQSLFHTVKIALLNRSDELPEEEEEPPEDTAARKSLSDKRFRSLQYLRNAPSVARLIRTLAFRTLTSHSTEPPRWTSTIRTFLEICSNIKSFTWDDPGFDFQGHFLPQIVLPATLNLSGVWSSNEAVRNGSSGVLIANLANLRYLKCSTVFHHSVSGELDYVLPTLGTLVITGFPSFNPTADAEAKILASYFPNLRELQIPLLNLASLHQPHRYLSLRRLYLTTSPREMRKPPISLDLLSLLPALAFLSIGIYSNGEVSEDSLRSLLPHLPPLLTHLEFPSKVPFEILLSALPTIRSVVYLGVSSANSFEEKKQRNIQQLIEASKKQGVKVYSASKS